jgi:hypothetical protein
MLEISAPSTETALPAMPFPRILPLGDCYHGRTQGNCAPVPAARVYLYDALATERRWDTITQLKFYFYLNDPNTFGINLQYFYGSGILAFPVTEESSTSVDVYFP